jgi:hypothetical protein
MHVQLLAEQQPPPEVVDLGTPEQVFVSSRWAAVLTRWTGMVLGFVLLAGGPALVTLFFGTATAELRATTGLVATILALGGLFFGLGVLLVVLGARPRERCVYAFYPDALAYCHGREWVVVPWDEVKAYRPQPLNCTFLTPSIVLRDGRTVLLQNTLLAPSELYDEVRRRVKGRAAPVPVPVAGAAIWIRPAGPVPLRKRPALPLVLALVLVVLALGVLTLSWAW